jgi:hypothetical protein
VKRNEKTGSKAQHQPVGFYSQQPNIPNGNNIFYRNELICQGTFYRNKNEIFLVPFEVSLLKRGYDLLIEFKRFGITAYLAKLHKTKRKNVYLFFYKNIPFEIDLSLEITALVKIAHTNNIVQFFSSGKNEEVWGCENDYTR